MKKILLVGETWVKNITHIKGFDTFITCHYEDASHYLRNAIEKEDYKVTHLAAHNAYDLFPKSLEELNEYSCIILSDIGANSFILSNDVFIGCKTARICLLELMKEYVNQGGALIMIGGYMSFSGIDGKARFGESPLKDVLPIKMLNTDDRVEKPSGIKPSNILSHEIIKGIDEEWPVFLGYNKLLPKEGSEIIVKIGEDPFIACGEYGKGKSIIFASDCAPHWGPKEFTDWKYYSKLWTNMLEWATK